MDPGRYPSISGCADSRSGSVLLGLLSRGVSPRDAPSLAHGMSPLDKALKLAFTKDTHHRVRFANERPKLTKYLRRRVILRLRKLSSRLRTARLRLTRVLLSKAPARSLNIPLIMLLVDRLGYPAKQLPRDLVYGMGMVGEMEMANSLATRTIPSAINFETLLSNLKDTNKTIPTNLKRSKDAEFTSKRLAFPSKNYAKAGFQSPR